MSGDIVARPLDDYDPAWVEWNRQAPHERRSVGAMAAGDDDAGGGADAGGDAGAGNADAAPADSKAVDASKDDQAAADAGDGGGGTDGGGGDAGGDKPAGGDDGASWRDGIKDEKVLSFAKTFRTPAEMAEKAFGLRQKVSTAIVKPGKDAGDDEKAAYRKAMGIPDDAAGYSEVLSEELRSNEAGKDSRESFFKAAHEAEMSAAQVKSVLDWYIAEVEKSSGAVVQAAEKKAQAAIDEMKQEEGPEFDKNTQLAFRTFDAFGGDGLKEFLETKEIDGIPLGNHPALRKWAINVGLQMQEAKPGIGLSDEQKGSLEDQHRKLSADINDALDRGDRRTAERLDAQRTAIADKLVGRNPIVGAEGRAA